jgi:hypothetical protein
MIQDTKKTFSLFVKSFTNKQSYLILIFFFHRVSLYILFFNFLLLMATPSGTPKKPSSPKKTTAKKPAPKKTTQKQMTTAETVASTEKVVDSAVEKATKKAAEHVSPELREKASKVAHQAESFATEVEKFGDSV